MAHPVCINVTVELSGWPVCMLDARTLDRKMCAEIQTYHCVIVLAIQGFLVVFNEY